ncbi:hypothetical protein Ait01nite_091750 [Actinoplanes italicus]|nr:hypothetical protein Ait01nite_091750 [Actinoplanes italicus]
MYGALCAVRLAQVGALGDFAYREPLDHYLDGLFNEIPRSPDDRECLIRSRRFFFGDDVTRIKFYQSKAIGIALMVGGDELSRPLSARGIMFATSNAWSSLDELCRSSTSLAFEEDHFRGQEMQLQGDDVMDIVHPPHGVDHWTPLRDRARITGKSVAASLLKVSQELHWKDELGIPGFRGKTAEEEEGDRLSSLVESDAPTDHW